MAVVRKIRHMNEDGSIIEADIGALAQNVKENESKRFVTDAEKEKWNGMAPANGGDISDTVLDVVEPESASEKYPEIPASGGASKTILGYLTRWVKSLKTDKADSNHNHDDTYVKISGGDIAATKMGSVTASTASYPVPAAGDTGKVFMGKIIKFFNDIRNATTGACFIGQIVNNCTSTDTKKPLSAAQGKALMDLYNGLNTKMNDATGNVNGVIKWLIYLPPEYIDTPNTYLKATGWINRVYFTIYNNENSFGWSLVLGIYDNNNGTPQGRQLALGVKKIMQRSFANNTWSSWTLL